MGSFNFKQNLNDIYFMYDTDFEVKDEETGETYIDYDIMNDIYSEIEADIDNELRHLYYYKYDNFFNGIEEGYISGNEFSQYIGIEGGYYDGFSIQLEDKYIDDKVIEYKPLMDDILNIYRNIGKKWEGLNIGHTYGWAGAHTNEYKGIKTIYDK